MEAQAMFHSCVVRHSEMKLSSTRAKPASNLWGDEHSSRSAGNVSGVFSMNSTPRGAVL